MGEDGCGISVIGSLWAGNGGEGRRDEIGFRKEAEEEPLNSPKETGRRQRVLGDDIHLAERGREGFR